MIKYIQYARKDHDKNQKRLSKEVQKDYHWIDKRNLADGESQELTAVKNAIQALGYTLIRVDSRYSEHTVTYAVD